jgi:transketolase
VIGHGAPGIEGTSKAHGSPLGPEVLAAAKAAAGWTAEPFSVPAEVRDRCHQLAAVGAAQHATWKARFATLERADAERAAEWRRTQARALPVDLDAVLASVERGQATATRQSSQAALRALTAALPELVGGSADLAGSTGTVTGQAAVGPGDFAGSVVNFGVREFAMAAVLNGLSLHGGFRPYGSTFLVFSDYLRPALRLSALMRQPVIYVLTHDSVAVGEDGPTHQPVEHVESLRMIPGVRVLRPADDHETVAAWRAALEHTDGPTVLVLTRQAVPSVEPVSGWSLPEHGARVVVPHEAPEVDLLATGSEVGVAMAAAALLREDGVGARVISVPWRERFVDVRESFGTAPLTVGVEAGVRGGWGGLTQHQVGIDEFGASGPGDTVLAHFGFTPQAVADRVLTTLADRNDATDRPTAKE